MDEKPKDIVQGPWPAEEIKRAEAGMASARRRFGLQSRVNTQGVHVEIHDGEEGLKRTKWATRSRAAQVISEERRTSISGTALSARMKKRFKHPETRDIVLEDNRVFEGVKLTDAEVAVDDLAEISIFLQKDGVHVDEEGKKWATVSAMVKEFGAAKPAIKDRLDGVERMRARTYKGKPTWIYDMAEVAKRISPLTDARKNTPVKVDENGYYRDETYNPGSERGLWATIDAFYASLDKDVKKKTSNSALRRYAQKHCRSLETLDREERPGAKVYPIEELKALSIFTSEIRVEANGIYTDTDKEEWASRNTWQEIFRVSQKALSRGVNEKFENWENVPSIRGFGLAKREDDLYSREAILEALSYIFDTENLAVNDVITVIEETAEGARETLYLSPEELTKIIPEDRLPRYTYRRRFAESRIDGPDRNNGGEIAAFSLDAVIDSYRDQIQDILDAIEEVDEESQRGEGKLLSISEYLQKNPRTDRKKLIANTDNIERVRRRKEGKIVYMYREKDLDKAA